MFDWIGLEQATPNEQIAALCGAVIGGVAVLLRRAMFGGAPQRVQTKKRKKRRPKKGRR